MSGVGFWGLLLVALIAASCSYVFSAKLARTAREWEEKRHAVKTVEHFCDVLLQDSIAYWSGVARDNDGQMQATAHKMAAMIFNLSVFVYNNFPGNTVAASAIGEVETALTDGDFATMSRRPNYEKVQMSASALVKLRFAVQMDYKTAKTWYR